MLYRRAARDSATMPTRTTCKLDTRKMTVVVEISGKLRRSVLKPV
jgi:hypothetical protein